MTFAILERIICIVLESTWKEILVDPTLFCNVFMPVPTLQILLPEPDPVV